MAREYGLNLNILQASLECIQHLTLGIMIVAVDASDEKCEAGLRFLADKHLKVETIGYVARETLWFSHGNMANDLYGRFVWIVFCRHWIAIGHIIADDA